MYRLLPNDQFELEKLQVYDIINNSQMGAVHWIKFFRSLTNKLLDAYVKELLKNKKQRLQP